MSKKIFFLIIIAILIGLPIWQVKTNSKDLVGGVVKQLNLLGAWDYQDFSTETNGVITLRGVHFVPSGYQQGFNVEQIRLNAGLKPLLLSYGGSLLENLPARLSVSFYGARMDHNGSDLQRSIGNSNFWPLVASDLGAFGCGDNKGLSFSAEQWQQLLPTEDGHDIDFSYALNPNDGYKMVFDFNLRTEQTWSLGWSGDLSRGSNDGVIDFSDVSVQQLKHYFQDQGFNQRRNEMCAAKYQGSFASYRLAAANQLQKYLRTYAAQEMSEDLENQYQRTLLNDAEVGLIFDFEQPKFFSELAKMSRLQWFGDSSTEAALGENQYQKIVLKPIDHLQLNMDLLQEQMQATEQLEVQREQQKQVPKAKENPVKTVVYHTGGKLKKVVVVKDWSTVIGKQVTINTKKGKPLTGILLDANAQYASISTRYAQGKATLNIGRENIESITIRR